jgi:hypothetical protein
VNAKSLIRPRAITLITGALLLQACSSTGPSDVALPQGAVAAVAPAAYQEWAAKTEACSGIRGDFSTVKWYVVPGVDTFSTAEGPKVGEWISSAEGDRIIIAGNYRNHEMVVSHEFLHHLLQKAGHPADYFSTKCHLTWDSWNATQGVVIAGQGD